MRLTTTVSVLVRMVPVHAVEAQAGLRVAGHGRSLTLLRPFLPPAALV